MPLKRQPVRGAFVTGVDTGVSDPVIKPEGLLRLENAIFLRNGAIGKRGGTTDWGGSTNVGHQIFTNDNNTASYGNFEDDLSIREWDGTSAFVKATDGTTDDQSLIPDPRVCATQTTARYSSAGKRYHHVSYAKLGTSYELFVAEYDDGGTNTVDFISINQQTKHIVDLESVTGACCFTAVQTANGDCFAIYITGTTLSYKKVSTSNGTFSTGTLTVTHTPKVASIDAIKLSGDDVAIAYVKNATDDSVSAVFDMSAFTESGSYSDGTITKAESVGLFNMTSGATFNYGFVYYDRTLGNLYGVFLDNTAATVYGAAASVAIANGYHCSGIGHGQTTDDSICFVNRKSQVSAGHSDDDGPLLTHVLLYESGGSMAFGTAYHNFGIHMVAKPFLTTATGEVAILSYYQGGKWYDTPDAIDKSTAQRNYTIFEVHALQSLTVGTAMYEQANGLLGTAGHSFASNPDVVETHWDNPFLANYHDATATGSDEIQIPVLKILSSDTTSLSLMSYGTESIGAPFQTVVQTRNANGVTLIPSSIGWEYDGSIYTNMGFINYPEGLSVSESGTSGTWSSTGIIKVAAIYEWMDTNGKVHRSAPSPIVSHTLTAANKGIIVKVPAYTGRRKSSGVNVVLYRTDLDGDILYRQQTFDADGSDIRVSSTVDNGDDTITGTDADSNTIPAVETIYTDGSVLENVQPRPHRISCIFANRYFYVDSSEEDSLIYYSKEFFPGLGTEHSDSLVVRCNPSGGKIVALAEMDEKLFILKEDAIYATHGFFGDDSGAGANFIRPRLVSNTVGCVSQASVQRIPDGLVFMSKSGIYILSRDEQAAFIGRRVQYLTSSWLDSSIYGNIQSRTVKRCSSSSVNHIGKFVIWSCASSDGTQGEDSIVYNYEFNQFSVFNGSFNKVQSFTNDPSVGLSMIKRSPSTAFLYFDETTGSPYTDDSSSYSMVVETGWFSFAGIAGYKRLYETILIAENVANHRLRVKIAYDGDPNWTDDFTIDSNQFSTFTSDDYYGSGLDSSYTDQAYKVEIVGSRQKCDMVRFHFSDEDLGATATTKGFVIKGLAFDIGVKAGLTKAGRLAK